MWKEINFECSVSPYHLKTVSCLPSLHLQLLRRKYQRFYYCPSTMKCSCLFLIWVISTFLNLYSRVRYKVVCSLHYLLARLNYFTLLWRCIAVCVNGVLFFWNSKSPEYGGVWIWVHVVIARFLLSFSPPRYSHLICHRFSSRVQSAYSSVNIIWITFSFSFTVWILQGE